MNEQSLADSTNDFGVKSLNDSMLQDSMVPSDHTSRPHHHPDSANYRFDLSRRGASTWNHSSGRTGGDDEPEVEESGMSSSSETVVVAPESAPAITHHTTIRSLHHAPHVLPRHSPTGPDSPSSSRWLEDSSTYMPASVEFSHDEHPSEATEETLAGLDYEPSTPSPSSSTVSLPTSSFISISSLSCSSPFDGDSGMSTSIYESNTSSPRNPDARDEVRQPFMPHHRMRERMEGRGSRHDTHSRNHWAVHEGQVRTREQGSDISLVLPSLFLPEGSLRDERASVPEHSTSRSSAPLDHREPLEIALSGTNRTTNAFLNKLATVPGLVVFRIEDKRSQGSSISSRRLDDPARDKPFEVAIFEEALDKSPMSPISSNEARRNDPDDHGPLLATIKVFGTSQEGGVERVGESVVSDTPIRSD